MKVVHRFARSGVTLEDSLHGGFMVHHNSESSLVVEVMFKQHLNKLLVEFNRFMVRFMSYSPYGG